MGKAIEKVLKKELKKLHNQLTQDENKISELYDLLDGARFIAGCRSCEKEKEYSKAVFTARYVSCRLDEPCKVVSDIAVKIKQAEQKEGMTREEYGKKVLSVLQENKPVLIDLKDKSEIQWDEVFGADYAKLSEDEKVSLIALVELDGGSFRIKGVTSIF